MQETENSQYEDSEFDLHVWKKKGDNEVLDLYTVSCGKYSVCHDAPFDDAISLIADYMQNQN